jgi:hypothetical protein
MQVHTFILMHDQVVIEFPGGETPLNHFHGVLGSCRNKIVLIYVVNQKLQNVEGRQAQISNLFYKWNRNILNGKKSTHAMLKERLKNQAKPRLWK